MTIRRAVAAFGVLVGAALASPAQQPAPAAPTPADGAVAAAGAVARGAATANVVPGAFRAQLVVDNRFPPKVTPQKGEPLKDEDRDPKDRTGKVHCLVCEHGLAPVIAIFVRSDLKNAPPSADGGLGKLIKGADGLIPKYRSDKLAAFALFLNLEGGFKAVSVKKPDGSEEKVEAPKEYPDDENRKAYVDEITKFAAALSAENVPLGLAPTSSPSVTAFGIGDATPVTVIVYNRLRMVQRWELKSDELTDEKIGEILRVAEESVTGVKQEPKGGKKE